MPDRSARLDALEALIARIEQAVGAAEVRVLHERDRRERLRAEMSHAVTELDRLLARTGFDGA